MENQNGSSPLMVAKKATELIKPSKQTPSQTLSLSTLDNDPYNEVMYFTIYVYKGDNTTRAFGDPEILLREALSDLLVYYYPLSGKLSRQKHDGKLQISRVGEGVPFTVATANLDLSSLDYLENIGFEAATQLLPESDHEDYDIEIGYHPLAIQVTKYPCGGFTIGTALTHAVCDGFGVAHFISGLLELAAAKSSEPKVVPTWERDRLVGVPDDRPVNVPGAGRVHRFAVSPYIPSEDMISEAINVKAESIKRLKQELLRESDFSGEILTTFEVLGAYIWKSRVRALKLNPEGIVMFGLAVAIRQDMDPPLPEGYYGNACIDMHVELTAREVEEAAISEIVKLIKEAKKKAHEKEYIEEELRNKEKLLKMGEWFNGRRDGLFFVTDWRNIGWFGSMDFGWGEPVNLMPVVPPEQAMDLGMILRPWKLDEAMIGGVKVVVTLPREAMAKFKEEMEALNKSPDQPSYNYN